MNDETADKTQKRRSSRLQAFATWGRINGSMNLEEEIKK